jgi:hypothetical protein
MLKPEMFFNLIKDFNIDYPFIPKLKIIEFKSLMSKENIKTNDALKIIENYKEHYWFLDNIIIFEPTIDKLKRSLKRIDSNITEKEINIELINYQKHLQAKRENIYSDLILEIRGLTPQQTEIEKELPAPESPNIGAVEEKKKKRIATIVILLFAQKVNQKEKFFDEPINSIEQYNKFAAAINTKFGFNLKGSTLKKEASTKETSKHRSKTIDLLKQFGYHDLSTQYQLESKSYSKR